MEDVQGVLTLFCSGAAQVVCHALRVVELREQLEVEEEDGDRQEEEVEVESGEVESKRVHHVDDHGWKYESAVRVSSQAVEQRCVQSQCMYATRPSMCRCIVSTSSLVSCLVSCLLYASFQSLFVMML